MRDPARIYKIQNLITTLWGMNPELRYLQLMDMIQCKAKQMYPDAATFYLEDDKAEVVIVDLINNPPSLSLADSLTTLNI
jgi:hypothetical protein